MTSVIDNKLYQQQFSIMSRSSNSHVEQLWIEQAIPCIEKDGCYSCPLHAVLDDKTAESFKKLTNFLSPLEDSSNENNPTFDLNIVANYYPIDDQPRKESFIGPLYERLKTLYGIVGDDVGKKKDNMLLLQDPKQVSIDISMVHDTGAAVASIGAISFLSFPDSRFIAVTHLAVMCKPPSDRYRDDLLPVSLQLEIVGFLMSTMNKLHIYHQMKPEKRTEIDINTMMYKMSIKSGSTELITRILKNFWELENLDQFIMGNFQKFVMLRRIIKTTSLYVKTGKSKCHALLHRYGMLLLNFCIMSLQTLSVVHLLKFSQS